ncbi:MAG TPA: helix-turn-helix domain-containing protein, partial [Ktedonobacterales bacterium]|nr:helix-turn-helix domain-containing protein [Ktedonobacterales bacterium]
RHWQHGTDPRLARGAQFVLWAARGWSAPALARVVGCCRRTVRHWLRAFLSAGLAGLNSRSGPRAKRPVATPDSAMTREAAATGGRLVPAVPISIAELRRILAFQWFNDPVSPDFFWHWSTYRRYKQALAKRSH